MFILIDVLWASHTNVEWCTYRATYEYLVMYLQKRWKSACSLQTAVACSPDAAFPFSRGDSGNCALLATLIEKTPQGLSRPGSQSWPDLLCPLQSRLEESDPTCSLVLRPDPKKCDLTCSLVLRPDSKKIQVCNVLEWNFGRSWTVLLKLSLHAGQRRRRGWCLLHGLEQYRKVTDPSWSTWSVSLSKKCGSSPSCGILVWVHTHTELACATFEGKKQVAVHCMSTCIQWSSFSKVWRKEAGCCALHECMHTMI